MLDNVSHYMDFMQYQSWDHQTRYTYTELKKEFCSTNNLEYELWIFLSDIKRCVSGGKKYVSDWRIVLSTWLVKIGTDLSRKEVLVLEDTGFQQHQMEGLSPRHML